MALLDQRNDISLRFRRFVRITDSQDSMVREPGNVGTVETGGSQDTHFATGLLEPPQKRKTLLAVALQNEYVFTFEFHDCVSRRSNAGTKSVP